MTNGSNARQVGKNRDTAIIQLIDECKFISREQVQELLFPGQEYRQKCCQRLQKLHKAKKIKRRRVDVVTPYVYFPPGVTWNQKAEHTITLNWVYIALVRQIKSWFRLHVFKREYFCQWGDQDSSQRDGQQDSNRLLADALVVLDNTIKKRLHPVFVEIDRGTSNNRFDKVERYSDYYYSKAWVKQWWAQKDDEGRYRFPKVLVISDRAEQVNRIIEKENKAGIRFAVATLADVAKDVYRFV